MDFNAFNNQNIITIITLFMLKSLKLYNFSGGGVFIVILERFIFKKMK